MKYGDKNKLGEDVIDRRDIALYVWYINIVWEKVTSRDAKITTENTKLMRSKL